MFSREVGVRSRKDLDMRRPAKRKEAGQARRQASRDPGMGVDVDVDVDCTEYCSGLVVQGKCAQLVGRCYWVLGARCGRQDGRRWRGGEDERRLRGPAYSVGTKEGDDKPSGTYEVQPKVG